MANQTFQALGRTAATTGVNGGDLENLSGRAGHVVINITTITGTAPTATFTVQGKDPISGQYYTLLASAALTAAGATVLRIGPGLTAAANLVANDVLPKVFRVICATGGTVTNLTCTVGVSVID